MQFSQLVHWNYGINKTFNTTSLDANERSRRLIIVNMLIEMICGVFKRLYAFGFDD